MMQNDESKRSPVIKICNISKSFGNVQAIKDVCINLFEGDIAAIVGDNGAGKSTLIKLLSGVYNQDEGHFIIFDDEVHKLTPELAISSGITTVYQDLGLVDTLDVCSNIYLGKEIVKNKFFIDRSKMLEGAESLIKRLNINIPSIKVETSVLSGGQRQGIAIARSINQGGRILILDEPTAAMGIKESKMVFSLIRSLSEKGYTVILICHNLQQVFDISNRIIVLCHGKVIADVNTADTSEDEIVKYMTGLS